MNSMIGLAFSSPILIPVVVFVSLALIIEISMFHPPFLSLTEFQLERKGETN